MAVTGEKATHLRNGRSRTTGLWHDANKCREAVETTKEKQAKPSGNDFELRSDDEHLGALLDAAVDPHLDHKVVKTTKRRKQGLGSDEEAPGADAPRGCGGLHAVYGSLDATSTPRLAHDVAISHVAISFATSCKRFETQGARDIHGVGSKVSPSDRRNLDNDDDQHKYLSRGFVLPESSDDVSTATARSALTIRKLERATDGIELLDAWSTSCAAEAIPNNVVMQNLLRRMPW